jgi:hypothetical protein
MLKHQLVVHPHYVDRFVDGRSIGPYHREKGLSWYLWHAVYGDRVSCWVIISGEFGYVALAEAGSNPEEIEATVVDIIIDHLPEESLEHSLEEYAHVSLETEDVKWCQSDRMPIHVGVRYQEAKELLLKQETYRQAVEAIDVLNRKPLEVAGEKFAPVDGVEGLLQELEDSSSYDETPTNPLLQILHKLIGR